MQPACREPVCIEAFLTVIGRSASLEIHRNETICIFLPSPAVALSVFSATARLLVLHYNAPGTNYSRPARFTIGFRAVDQVPLR